MTGPKVDIGRDLVAFVAGQSSYSISDAAGESYPEAADAIRVIGGSAGGTVPFALREDKFGTATGVPGIEQKRTAEGSIEGYVMPSGTLTTIPDMGADLLVKGGWKIVNNSSTTTAVSGGSSTAVKVDVNSVTGFSVGDGIIVETGNGTGFFEARRIVEVNSSATPDFIKVEPALTFTPSASATVKGVIAYKPSDERDDAEDACCLWLMNNNSADRISGWTPDSYEFTMGGEDAARFTASGTGQRHDRLFQTGLDSDLTTGSGSVTVVEGLASSGDAVNTYWLLENGGVTAPEAVKVTAISGATWTITRGAVSGFPNPGSTWSASNTTMRPFRPTGTYAGSPVPATSGQLVVSPYGATQGLSLQINNASLSCSFGVTTRDDVMGTLYKAQGYTMNQREVRATLSGWTLKDENMSAHTYAFQAAETAGANSQQLSVACQTGEAAGSIFAWIAPRMRQEDVSLDRGAEEVTLDMTGLCEGTSSGADEILIIFA
tara:strand:- start:849 stop:2321 length:1473 start_codon:yes stop_codon:yes gene_type:complete